MDIELIKNNINHMVCEGTVSEMVLKELIDNSGFVVPLETILWDYKLTFDSSANGYKKTLKSVVSLYNTYGGYIIYGIDELVKDTKFQAVGIDANQIDLQKLRGQFDKYFGRRISIAYQEIELTVDGSEKLFGLLYVPKRKHYERSLSPIMDASDGKKFILDKFAIYFRTEDECKQVVSNDDFVFISSPRAFSEMERSKVLPQTFIQNNLPDKSFICPVFVGRFTILEELWAWLADDLQHSKVLAADGGKGKTSIAYEFCQLLINSKVEGIEQIIWLTAKSKQFKAAFNEYIGMPETHYNDLDTLLTEICLRTGSLVEELDDLSTNQLVKLAKRNLEDYPSFVVIDDVDSNIPDEQKRILEAARLISSERSKVLLTTRVNTIYSADTSIVVPGMEGEEYRDLVASLCSRLSLPRLNDRNIRKLEVASEGSPLFTESILRLYKLGSALNDAIDEWSNKSGEAVREAALKKEVSELSVNAKRVLATVCTVGSCSKTELQQMTELERIEISDALQELDLLFLLNSVPFIESEPRFESSSSISNLVLSVIDQLLPDAKTFLQRVSRVSHGLQSNSKKYQPRVGEAVRQCNALLKDNKFSEARETLTALIKLPEYKENKDLHFLSAAIEYADPDADKGVISAAFHQAYAKGQRKVDFFEQWYTHVVEHESSATILEVCQLANNSGLNYARWADRYLSVAKSIADTSPNVRSALDTLHNAFEIYVKTKRSRRDRWQFKSESQQVLNRLVELCDRLAAIEKKANILIFAINNGDISSKTCQDLVVTSKQLRQSKNNNSRLLDRMFSCLSETQDLLKEQKNPRILLISSLNEELIEHTVAR
ncbi:RNA-binding domain-containing protein [Vibrio vulnificus]|uniref:ATP-binding protein n=1 Tax=Vibrio vulnificus TaxID=672 RepID=UPI00130287CE|nr:ATP-binding protein [Vibrio vulnificus]EGQ7937302.1 ATP-binding protein [Vibrio vulnificus]EIA1287810.1 ATP-binding protein [Vibrio vulnificus]MCU8510307.1 ATP-binding protein [Vibrio vulnificus]